MTIPFSFIGLLAGIIVCGEFNITVSFALALISAAACIFVSVFKRRFYFPLFCTLVFLLLGTVLCNNALNLQSEFSRFENQEVTVYGRICEIPDKYTRNHRYTVNVQLAIYNDTSMPTNENIIISTPHKFNYDDVICATGTLKKISEKQNKNSFNFSLYYKSHGIQYTMYCENPTTSDVHLTSASLHSYINKFRNSTINLINSYFEGDTGAILAAMITGHKNLFSEKFDNLITKTGIKRCMYPAYLHIMIIFSLISMVRRSVHKKYRTVIIVLILLIYGIFNSYNPILVKSIAFVGLVYLFKYRFGYVYKPDILCIVVGAILISNPLLIYNGGFVISVVASILIFAFGGLLYKNLKHIKAKRLRQSIGTNIILSVGLIPLCAYYFGGVSIYQIPLTLIFIPLTSVMLIFAPVTLVMLKIFGSAPLFYGILNLILNIYIKIAVLADKLPLSYLNLPTPGVFSIIAFYILVYALYLYFNKRRFKAPLLMGCSLLCVLIGVEIISSYTMQITFVNVGQGDATLISIPYRTNILIDGGGSSDYQEDYNIGEEIFVPYLQREGKTHIDAIFVSHYHKDHVEGVIAGLENLNVKEIYMPDYLKENELRKQIEQSADKYDVKINYITKDTSYNLGNGIVVDAIVPTRLALFTEDENNTTVVYKLSYGKTSCLFTGDITSIAEFGLINENKNIKSDILKVAHHGSANSTSSDFVQAVNPKYSVICAGVDNPYGFPKKEVLKNLAGTTILRTDQNGDITFTLTRSGIKYIKTMK